MPPIVAWPALLAELLEPSTPPSGDLGQDTHDLRGFLERHGEVDRETGSAVRKVL